MYVGEFANLIGVALFVAPTWLVYRAGGRSKKAAVRAMAVSVPVRVAFSCCINAFITLPMYAAAMGLSLDEVIVSVGVSPNPLIPRAFGGLEVSKKGTIVVEEDSMRSALGDVYAGGDIVRGGATVILAMGDGRKAAAAMDADLRG